MKIFITTSGQYQDFFISAIFSTRGKAERYLAQRYSDPSDRNEIEEFELDAEVK